MQQMINWWYFSYFYQKTGLHISGRLSPMEIICIKCQNLFLGKIRKLFQIVVCWIILPRVLSVRWQYRLWKVDINGSGTVHASTVKDKEENDLDFLVISAKNLNHSKKKVDVYIQTGLGKLITANILHVKHGQLKWWGIRVDYFTFPVKRVTKFLPFAK